LETDNSHCWLSTKESDVAENFEEWLDAWCEKNLGGFDEEFDHVKHFHRPRAERLRNDAEAAGFDTAILPLERTFPGGLVGYVRGRTPGKKYRAH
jgi:hypothetical protein